jgi:hypothetical protein
MSILAHDTALHPISLLWFSNVWNQFLRGDGAQFLIKANRVVYIKVVKLSLNVGK